MKTLQDSSKKIVHVLYSGLGGHGSVFFSLVKADSSHEYATSAIFCGIEPVREEYKKKCERFQVPFVSLIKKRGLDLGIYMQIYKSLKRTRPNVLVLHGPSFILISAIYKFFNRSTKLIVRDTQAHHLKTKMEWYWLKLAIRFSDNIILLSPEALEGIKQQLKGTKIEDKAAIIPNGLDTDLYAAAPVEKLPATVSIGMQSRLQVIKDHATLIKAFHLLIKDFPAQYLQLKIAGDGETRQGLEGLTKTLEISDVVRFEGMLDENELLVFMGSLQVYVHATFGEMMSNSIMQAMACGLPIIASDVWGVNNMVEDEINGLLFQPNDDEGLARQLKRILTDDILRERISKAARQKAVTIYSHHTLFKKYKALYGI